MPSLAAAGRKVANTILIGAIAITPMVVAPSALANTATQPQPGIVSAQNTDIYQTVSASEWLYSCRYFKMWYCARFPPLR